MGHTKHVVNNNHHKVAATLLRPYFDPTKGHGAIIMEPTSIKTINSHDTNVSANKQNNTKNYEKKNGVIYIKHLDRVHKKHISHMTHRILCSKQTL